MLFVGWRLRLRRAGYALALQGGGIGVLYLTVFASLRLFGLLPAGRGASALLLLIAVLSAALAVLQNSQSLAILGASGGFLAPDPHLDRRRQPRHAVQLLRGAQRAAFSPSPGTARGGR